MRGRADTRSGARAAQRGVTGGVWADSEGLHYEADSEGPGGPVNNTETTTHYRHAETHTTMRIHLTVHLQILLAVGLAIFCFCLVLGCIICWRRRKSFSYSDKEAGLSLPSGTLDHVTVTLSPSPSINVLPIKQQYEELDGDVLDYPPQDSSSTPSEDDLSSLSRVQVDPKGPQKSSFPLRRLSSPVLCSSPSKLSVRGRASLPSIPKLGLVSKTRRALDRRSTVAGDNFLCTENSKLTSGDQQGALSSSPYGSSPQWEPSSPKYGSSSRRSSISSKQPPSLHFTLLFSPAEGTLTVTVLGLFRASRRVSGATVRASLPPVCPAALQGVPARRHSLSPEPQAQVLTLQAGSLEELKSCTLRLVAYGKDFSGLRETPLGDLELTCAEMDWEADAAVMYNLQLNPARRRLKKSQSTQESLGSLKVCPSRPLGQLFILLQYQTQAQRIKVMVRKAENLAKLTRMPGAADHYVVINLRQGGKVICTKETKGASGSNAVWNAPFLFDLPAGDIVRLSLVLEFIVMQGRLYTKSSVLGRVLIGYEGPEAGQQHWKEMCDRGQVETARWHTLQPDTL
ncbi:synaptotagmin-11 [Astyanax mexicanus]|uniref:synaptotagmin-11 n=1 Tax=Astyanax mexicanus TaxID=7994 RepID=UPI0020CAD086|nr:synaptotagmin-11 [Astyanax mexicanus]